MNTYSGFKPTYLYIKQHTITGKLYFGKTVKNPEKYLGSGLHWKAHIKKHGNEHVVNLWYYLFDSMNECISFALEFSNKMNIVESDQWLNLTVENSISGGAIPACHSVEAKSKRANTYSLKTNSEHQEISDKISKSKIGKFRPDISVLQTGKLLPESHKQNISDSMKGLKQKQIQCPHCLKIGGNLMKRWHFDNCKSK